MPDKRKIHPPVGPKGLTYEQREARWGLSMMAVGIMGSIGTMFVPDSAVGGLLGLTSAFLIVYGWWLSRS